MTTDQYHGLWRGSAYEAVPYTDDFPEALLVLPELSDGSIGQGNATRVTIQISLNGEKSKLTVTDNGIGIRYERRLLSWAAKDASSNMHRNGHGTKKCLTKWAPDYDKANWEIRWRLPGKNLQTTTGPFIGYSADSINDDGGEDSTTLMPSGCEISIEFNAAPILRDLATNPKALYASIKEIIQSRYSEETLSKTEFILNISHSSLKKPILRSSRKDKWHSFRQCVEDSVKMGDVKKRHTSKYDFDGGYLTIDTYSIEGDGKRNYKLKDEFPTYGNKNMKSSRVHTSLDIRTIEAKPAYQLLEGIDSNHNKYNGLITFATFISNTGKEDYKKLPIPCTTKVSMYENHPVYTLFIEKFNIIFPPIVREIEAEAEKRLTEKKVKKLEPPVEPLNVVVTKKPVVAKLIPVVAPTPVVTTIPVVAPTLVDTTIPVIAPTSLVNSTPVSTPPIPVLPKLPTPPIISLPPRSTTPVGGHTRLNGCSRQNLFDLLIHFREKINNLPLETLRETSPSTTEPGLAQKIQAIREIMESI